jgi:solute carrier family 36 (proton-coupled amino acid transporter)
MPLFFGIAVFNFEGNGVILNLQSSMKNPDEFLPILRNTLIMIIIILVLFSCFSYEAFGDKIDDMVTMNLPHDNLTSSVQLLYCLGLLGSFPMQMMPAIDITEKTQGFERIPDVSGYKSIVVRTVIVLMTGILAMSIPKFGLFINLSGAFACTALAFIFPVSTFH